MSVLELPRRSYGRIRQAPGVAMDTSLPRDWGDRVLRNLRVHDAGFNRHVFVLSSATYNTEMYTDLVKKGYDLLGQRYSSHRESLRSGPYIQQLLKRLPKSSTVLDVGCGPGIPVDDTLIKAGHQVIGIDNSPAQIAQARKHCPAGEYLVLDMQELRPNQYRAQAVVSLYSLFHVPRAQHAGLLATMSSYLPTGGMLLISMGDRAFEGPHHLMGVPLWSSQFGTVKNSEMVTTAGFSILIDEINVSGGERHQMILAEKV